MKRITRRTALTMAGTAAIAAAAEGAGLGTLSTNEGGEPDYRLHEGIEGLQIPKVVTVLGCGGFGAWPAFYAALSGVEHLILIDGAKIDELDLARAPFRPKDIGVSKAVALKRLIREFRPKARVEALEAFITVKDIHLLKGLVFNGANDLELEKELPALLKANGQKYVSGFYHGNTIGVASDYVPGLTFERGRNVPVWIGSASLAGVLALNSAFVSPFTFVGPIAHLHQPLETASAALKTFGADQMDK